VSVDAPPSSLSAAAQAFWRSITSSYELQEHHVAILNEALFSWDRCQEARSLIDAEGITLKDRFGQARLNPAVPVEKDQRTLYLRAMRELDIDGVPDADVRPPRASRNRP
jgi:P27 family predicted phage terminase small subunit